MLKIKLDLFWEGDLVGRNLAENRLKKVHSLCFKPYSLGSKDIKIPNFSSIYGLELDNNFLKSIIVLSQRGQLEWLFGQLERNKNTQSSLEEYQNSRFMYSQKQKNKNRTLLCPKIQNRQHLRVKTTIHEIKHSSILTEKSRRISTKEK